MATYVYPSSAPFIAELFHIGLRASVRVSTSPLNGNVQTVEIPGARWVLSVTYPRQNLAERAELEAFWSRVLGQINRVSIWHLSRPAPRGTMRGSPVLASTAAAGATTAAITTTPGATVKVGDMLGIGGQLVQVVVDATANGSGALSIEFAPRLRASAASGSAVVWDKPSATFILSSSDLRIPYRGSHGPEFAVDLFEVWS